MLVGLWIFVGLQSHQTFAAQQLHYDNAVPLRDHHVVQEFMFDDGFPDEIDILVTAYERKPFVLYVQLFDSERSLLNSQTKHVLPQDLTHPLELRFDPLPSASLPNQKYYLSLSSSGEADPVIWYSSYDTYPGGELIIDNQQLEGDLYFKAYTDCLWICDVSSWENALIGFIRLFPWIVLILFLPGLAILSVLPPTKLSVGDLGTAFALGLAIHPVFWLFANMLGIVVNQRVYTLFLLVLVGIILIRLWSVSRVEDFDLKQLVPRLAFGDMGILFTAVITMGLLLFAIRTFQYPLWIDSVKHAQIIKKLIATGRIFTSQRPESSPEFIYHFGYHTVIAAISFFSGAGLNQVMLYTGQFILLLTGLTTSSLVVRFVPIRKIQVLGLFLVLYVFTFPSHYVAWGRYTLLTGMAILPVTMILTLAFWKHPTWHLGLLGATAINWSGLFLTHYRVAVFGAAFVVAWVTVNALGHFTSGQIKFAVVLRRTLVLALLSCLIDLAWILHLSRSAAFQRALTWAQRKTIGVSSLSMIALHGSALLLISVGVLLGFSFIILVIIKGTKLKQNKMILVVLMWLGLLFFATYPAVFAPKMIPLFDGMTAKSVLYLPAILLLALVYDKVLVRLPNRRCLLDFAIVIIPVLSFIVHEAPPAILSSLQTTTLVSEADTEAFTWIIDNTPQDAVFLADTRLWAANTFVGTDGGYWINAVTGRQSIPPAADYVFQSPEKVKEINGLLRQVAQGSEFDQTDFLQVLRRQHVTHVYVGPHDGAVSLCTMMKSPHYRPIYTNGSVWLFNIDYQGNPSNQFGGGC